MPIPAKDLIQRIVITLHDTTSIRWPVDELVRYLNDAQREVLLYRPDAFVLGTSIALDPGTRQRLPVGATKLRDIHHNNAGQRRAIRLTSREVLDANLPGWHAQSPTMEVLHFMYGPLDPQTFYVYPPAAPGASVQATFSTEPVDVPLPAPGATFDMVTGMLALQAVYGNVAQDYVLYRAYSKDSEFAGNAARAQAHYAAFANALGIEVKATLALAPTAAGNPNVGPAGATK